MQLSHYISKRSCEHLQSGRTRTARAYRSTLNSVLSFTQRPVSLKHVFTPDFLRNYQMFLERKKLQPNTISFYMRMLRSLYNSALDSKLVCYIPKLFSHVYTGISSTSKRAVSPAVFSKFRNLSLSSTPSLELTRDLFLFSLYAQGISFVDMAYLLKKDIRGNIMSYSRHKTGRQITVYLLPEAIKIINKYSKITHDSPFLFPLILNSERNLRLQYESSLHLFNRNLGKLCALAGVSDKVTSYVARHSWATIAHHCGVSVSIIRQAMGHRTEEITQIYLASFNTDVLKKANVRVLKTILGVKNVNRKKVCHLLSDGLKTLQT